MITQSFLNTEVDLAKRIFIYYTDKILDILLVGDKDYENWYIDSLQIFALTEAIISVNVIDGKVYIGPEEVGEDFLIGLGSKVREYLTYELRQIVYAELDAEDTLKEAVIPPTPPIIINRPYALGWEYFEIIVTTDDVTTVALPFNIAAADTKSLSVTVNDQDPDHLVDPSAEGCHIVGTTLYWHNYYNLKTGDKIAIKFQRII